MPQDLGNTQDLVAVEDIRDDIVVMKSGGLRQVVMVNGINLALKSEAEQNTIVQLYQSFLNSLDFQLQIIIHSRKLNIENYLSTLDERRGKEISALLQDQILEYREFIRGFVATNSIMEKIFLVVVPFAPTALPNKESVTGFFSFLGGKKKDAKSEKELAAQNKQLAFEQNTTQLRQRTVEVTQNLAAIGLGVKILANQELVELFYNFYNPETIEKKNA